MAQGWNPAGLQIREIEDLTVHSLLLFNVWLFRFDRRAEATSINISSRLFLWAATLLKGDAVGICSVYIQFKTQQGYQLYHSTVVPVKTNIFFEEWS